MGIMYFLLQPHTTQNIPQIKVLYDHPYSERSSDVQNPFVAVKTILYSAFVSSSLRIVANNRGAMSSTRCPCNHLSHQNKVVAPFPISVFIDIEKKA
jgi:translation elongation factor EF-4